jgi:hypothetical protein
MKAFNLEQALAGKPVVTRDGRPVKIAGYNPDADIEYKICGWVNGKVGSWRVDGLLSASIKDAATDLFMAPTERKEWIVRIMNPTDHRQSYIAGPFKTLEAAKDLFNTRRKGWATIHEITITE